MKRSEINAAIRAAQEAFSTAGWALPPYPRWDVTDFGLGQFRKQGLVLVNLAEEPEYCEKIMCALRDQKTPAHCHVRKKEDIIVRRGSLRIQLWARKPGEASSQSLTVRVNGVERIFASGSVIDLAAGERVTLRPGVFHEFWPISDTCVIGEVSTANDDRQDNIFANTRIGRFPEIDEDEPALVRLVSEVE
jgi:D-lyxose ketol-isomerase